MGCESVINKVGHTAQTDIIYTYKYESPLGGITIAADNDAVTGLWFDGQRYSENVLPEETEYRENALIKDAKRWLDIYFSGYEPDFLPPLRVDSTSFRKVICNIMMTIPYGQMMSYGEIAVIAAERLKIEKMSAQAVGGAVGHNPISIMVPCHRVVGTNGNLTGYAGGIWRKVRLLELEQADMSRLYVPKKGNML